MSDRTRSRIARTLLLVLVVACLAVPLLAAAPAGAAGPVTNAAQLAAAWSNPGITFIDLGADIALCPGVQRTSSRLAIVNGHGHTVRGTCPVDLFVQHGTGAVWFINTTLRDVTTDEDQVAGSAVLAADASVVLVKTQVLNTQGFGGGAVQGKNVWAFDSTFANNSLIGDFGSHSAISAGDVVVWNSTFTDNSSRFTPGAINAGDDVTIHGSRFERNFASSSAGAVNALGDVSITGSHFVNNGTGGALGGVVSANKIDVRSSTFDDGDAGFGNGGFLGGASVRVRDSSFTNGRNFGQGGAIAGTDVVVKTSTFQSNSSSDGGAIATTGSLAVDRSTFAGNFTNEDFGTSSGGAIFQSGTGLVKITNSTFTQNHGTAGRGDGTAIATASPVQLTFVTVSGNPTSDQVPQAQIAGNGVSASLTSFGSVFADAGAGGNCSITDTTSQGFNYSDDGTCTFTQPTDHTSAAAPQLGPLAPNGGPTQTLLPAATSPLLDTIPGGSCLVHVDQRGVFRPRHGACDIGAVER